MLSIIPYLGTRVVRFHLIIRRGRQYATPLRWSTSAGLMSAPYYPAAPYVAIHLSCIQWFPAKEVTNSATVATPHQSTSDFSLLLLPGVYGIGP